MIRAERAGNGNDLRPPSIPVTTGSIHRHLETQSESEAVHTVLMVANRCYFSVAGSTSVVS